MDWNALQTIKEGETISLKGFLFQGQDGQWILSNEPDLKSCCIGVLHKQKNQVFLPGDFSQYTVAAPLKVQGTLHTSQAGALILSDAIVEKNGFPIWTVGALLIVCLVFSFKLKRLLLP